jgi:hypothetical protein
MCSDSLESTVKTGSSTEKDSPDENWETAQERVLLYLKYMNVPPGKDQLTLALEALKNIKAEGNGHEITPAAMGAVQDLLRKSNRVIEGRIQPKLYSMGLFEKQLEGLESVPPLNRGRMISVKFDQLSEWLSTESFLTKLIIQLRPLLLPVFILLNLLLLLCFFFWL